MNLNVSKWNELNIFQCTVAERWLRRGQKASDPYVRFFFYFSGFNALYFLWCRIDDLRNDKGKYVNEGKQIENLLGKFTSQEAEAILHDLENTISYFTSRSPIQRMDRRNADSPTIGDEAEGKKWRRKLMQESSPSDRLVALGQILYLVRCNLVHGNKSGSGDDHEIIEASVPALDILLERSLDLTRIQFGGRL